MIRVGLMFLQAGRSRERSSLLELLADRVMSRSRSLVFLLMKATMSLRLERTRVESSLTMGGVPIPVSRSPP